MDNTDGKQARRIGASSPMGLLIDHGCDAMTTFLFTQTMGTIMGLGNYRMLTSRECLLVYFNLANGSITVLSEHMGGILYW
jgi:ethanolaminephosphotransferase